MNFLIGFAFSVAACLLAVAWSRRAARKKAQGSDVAKSAPARDTGKI